MMKKLKENITMEEDMKSNYYILKGQLEEVIETKEERFEVIEDEVRYLRDKVETLERVVYGNRSYEKR